MTASINDGNSKLGPLLHSWSIPAEETCPGSSQLCRDRCYAKRGFFRMTNVGQSYQRNLEFCRTDEFVPWMVAVLQARFVRVMRIHVSGDFDTVEYAQKWVEIVDRSPNCLFFTYTRSWRVPEILPSLIAMSQQENFQLWWSIDRETGPAPVVRNVRRAYMAINDVDADLAPDDCDLVFRDSPDTVKKKVNGVQVCPPENGVKLRTKITCSKCGICWKSRKTKLAIALQSHFDFSGSEVLAPRRVLSQKGNSHVSPVSKTSREGTHDLRSRDLTNLIGRGRKNKRPDRRDDSGR